MTFQEMCDATKIPENELKRAVLTLALGKARVLTKKPMSKAIGERMVSWMTKAHIMLRTEPCLWG